MKRWIAGMAAAGMLMLCGCSKIDTAAYNRVKDAMDQTMQQQSGVMQITNCAPELEDMNLCLTYRYAEDGVLQYCMEQTDRSGRRIFLEHHDGNIMQRWLLGHGSTVYDETDSEFVRYTKEQRHPYLAMLQNMPDKKSVTDLTAEETDDGMLYCFILDPQTVKGEKDAEEILTARMLQYTVSDSGEISEYKEESCYQCPDGTDHSYTMSVTLSQLGAVSEVALPKIE